MGAQPELAVFDDAEALAAAVAQQAIATLATAQRARGEASLVLTGGSILEKAMSAIAAAETADSVAWERVDVFWGDERFVAADSDERNELPARRLLLDRLPFTASRIHPMGAVDGPFGSDVESAATGYAAELSEVARGSNPHAAIPAFDLVLLGMGPDGHCCSLFPGHPGTQVEDRPVIAVRDSPKPPPTRLSLTFAALAAADQIWVVAAGDGKADAVARGLSPGVDRVSVPVSGAQGREGTRWLLDAAAAGKLPNR